MSKPPKPILVFDTCALNRIAYASDSNSLVKGLTTAYSIKLSMLNLGEIYATQNSVTRDHLIQTLRPIVSHDGNDCWLPPHAILRRLIDTFKENREDFDWRSIDLRFPAGADEIARGEFLTDETSSEQLQHQVKYKKQFATLMKSAKSSFDAEFSAKRDPPPPEVFRDTILAKGEALWSLGKSLFAGNSEETLDDDAVTTLYNCCPPYQAFVLAMFISFYY